MTTENRAMQEAVDWFQHVREGGHIPDNLDFDDLAELTPEEIKEMQDAYFDAGIGYGG